MVKVSPGVSSLIGCLGGDDALGIGYSLELDGLQEVAQDLSEAFKVVAGRFPGDGRQFVRLVLEEGGDLLDRGNLALKHIGKLITYDKDRYGTV